MKNFYPLCLSIIVTLAIAGCKSSTTGPNSGNPLVPPAVGSTFTYDDVLIDPSGTKIPNSDQYFTNSILATGIQYQGKTNVAQESIEYVNYESNGDISRFVEANGQPGMKSGWITIPMTSKGKATFLAEHTTTPSGRHSTTNSYSYLGQESITLAGHTFSAFTFSYQAVDQTGATTNIDEEWFDSASGVLLRVYTPPVDTGAIPQKGDHLNLTSYTLK